MNALNPRAIAVKNDVYAPNSHVTLPETASAIKSIRLNVALRDRLGSAEVGRNETNQAVQHFRAYAETEVMAYTITIDGDVTFEEGDITVEFTLTRAGEWK